MFFMQPGAVVFACRLCMVGALFLATLSSESRAASACVDEITARPDRSVPSESVEVQADRVRTGDYPGPFIPWNHGDENTDNDSKVPGRFYDAEGNVFRAYTVKLALQYHPATRAGWDGLNSGTMSPMQLASVALVGPAGAGGSRYDSTGNAIDYGDGFYKLLCRYNQFVGQPEQKPVEEPRVKSRPRSATQLTSMVLVALDRIPHTQFGYDESHVDTVWSYVETNRVGASDMVSTAIRGQDIVGPDASLKQVIEAGLSD